MAEPNKHDRNDDNSLNPKSPNDRDKKKTKVGHNDPNEDSMDVEFKNLPNRSLFGDDDAPDALGTSLTPSPSIILVNPPATIDSLLPTVAPHPSPIIADPSLTVAVPVSTDVPDDDTRNPFLLSHLASVPIWTLPIKAAKPLWFANPKWSSERPYTADELDGTKCNYDESLEFDIGVALVYVAHDVGIAASVPQWMYVYAHAFAKEDDSDEDNHRDFQIICRMAIRLALSNPVNLFPKSSWHNGALTTTLDEHVAWVASYLTFGAPWKNHNDWFVTSAPSTNCKSKRKSD
jgi:hypothetical protein